MYSKKRKRQENICRLPFRDHQLSLSITGDYREKYRRETEERQARINTDILYLPGSSIYIKTFPALPTISQDTGNRSFSGGVVRNKPLCLPVGGKTIPERSRKRAARSKAGYSVSLFPCRINSKKIPIFIPHTLPHRVYNTLGLRIGERRIQRDGEGTRPYPFGVRTGGEPRIPGERGEYRALGANTTGMQRVAKGFRAGGANHIPVKNMLGIRTFRGEFQPRV
jgi:hypothetical protein